MGGRGRFFKDAMAWLPDWKWKQKKKGVDASKTVWIGEVPDGATFKELKALGDQVGGCKWAEVYKFKGKSTGAIGFASPAEAANAIPSLNSALIGGQAITADSWEKMTK